MSTGLQTQSEAGEEPGAEGRAGSRGRMLSTRFGPCPSGFGSPLSNLCEKRKHSWVLSLCANEVRERRLLIPEFIGRSF